MLKYRTVTAALAALERGMIVDAIDNALPPRVLASLCKRAMEGQTVNKRLLYFRAHIRYVGNREVWYFVT